MALTEKQKQELLKKFPVSEPTGESATFSTPDSIASRRQALSMPTETPSKGVLGTIADVGIGAVKGATGTLQNIGNIIAKPVGSLMGIPKDQIGFSEQALTPTNTAQKIGKFGEQVAEFAIPATKVGTLTKGFSGATQLGARALTSGATATAQEGEIGSGTAIATGLELAFPVFGKVMSPVKKLIGSLASGLSGASSETLNLIKQNPEVAKQAFERISQEGGEEVLKSNAQKIISGVRTIKKEASDAYGKALEQLETVPISKVGLKTASKEVLDNSNILIKNGKVNFSKSDILDPTIQKKATTLINTINKQTDLSGKGVKKILDYIEGQQFKSTGTDANRQAFNQFTSNLIKQYRNTIAKGSPILEEANKQYSKDINIANTIQQVLGKVKFGNTQEMVRIANNLDSLFKKRGIAPQAIDDFLSRVGIVPQEFRTTEAVRQLGNIEDIANAKGLNISEIMRSLTSTILPPETIGKIAVLTGLGDNVVKPIFEKIAPASRATLLEMLTSQE